MLSDMAEASGDYSEHDPYGEEYDDDDDMSGSGDNMNCKLHQRFRHNRKLIFFILLLLPLDGREVPVVEPGSPDDLPNGKHDNKIISAGSTTRISQVSASLVLSSLIVILFKQF